MHGDKNPDDPIAKLGWHVLTDGKSPLCPRSAVPDNSEVPTGLILGLGPATTALPGVSVHHDDVAILLAQPRQGVIC